MSIQEQSGSPSKIIQNTSLAINSLSEQFDQNENQIYIMESFITHKHNEIKELQSFLLAEFQNIENWKSRNRKIERMIVTETLPSLTQVKNLLHVVKSIISPIFQLASSFTEVLSEKSRVLLREKHLQNERLKENIVQLNKKIQILNEECRELKRQKYLENQNNNKIVQCANNQNVLRQITSNTNFKDTHAANEQLRHQNSYVFLNQNKKASTRISPSSDIKLDKTPSKLTKHEECYKNILQSKKSNISYKCERVINNNNSEKRLASRSSKKISEQLKHEQKQEFKGCDRKQYIKQKIEKIKIKAQYRENKNHNHNI